MEMASKARVECGSGRSSHGLLPNDCAVPAWEMFISVLAFWWKGKEADQLRDTDADVYFGRAHEMDQHCFPHTQFNPS